MKSRFEYLKYPPELYRQKPKLNEAVAVNSDGKKVRKLFHGVDYDYEEKQKIQEFRQFALQNNKILDCNDFQILRYLYSNDFDFKQSLQKISVYLDWTHDPAIQTISHKASWILSEGAIFTYGRDKQNRPIVYLDLTKIKLDRYEIADYYCAFNAVLNVVVEQCFVPGVIETYLFVIDMGGKNFTSLPLDALGNIIKKMSIVYSMYLGSMLVINAQTFVKFTYNAVKMFIHEDTRKKIVLLNTDEVDKIGEYVDKDQLFRRYHGFNADPFEYWPPQIPGHKKVRLMEEESVYYSIEENESLFDDVNFETNTETGRSNCCDYQCGNFQSCTIF